MSSHRSKSDTHGSSKGKGKAKAALDSKTKKSKGVSEQDPRSVDHDGVSFGDPWASDDAVFEIGPESYNEYAWESAGDGNDGHYKHRQQDPLSGFPGDDDDDEHYNHHQQDQILGYSDDNDNYGYQQPEQHMQIRDGKGKGVEDPRKGNDRKKGDDHKKGDDRKKGEDRKKGDDRKKAEDRRKGDAKRETDKRKTGGSSRELHYPQRHVNCDDEKIYYQQQHVQIDEYDDDQPSPLDDLDHGGMESPEGFWGHETRKDNPGPYVPRPPACPLGHGLMQLDASNTWVCVVCGASA